MGNLHQGALRRSAQRLCCNQPGDVYFDEFTIIGMYNEKHDLEHTRPERGTQAYVFLNTTLKNGWREQQGGAATRTTEAAATSQKQRSSWPHTIAAEQC